MPLINTSFKTLTEMFNAVFAHYHGRTEKFALARKVNGKYQGITHDELHREVLAFAGFLKSLGVEKGDRVAILSENRPQWVVVDMATMMIGAINVPLYPSLPPNQIAYIIQNSECRAVITSTMLQLNKIRKIRAEVPTIKAVVSINELDAPDDAVTDFEAAKKIGEKFNHEHPNAFANLELSEHDLATLVYTSGTTGNPKGVMLTHRNLCENVKSCDESMCKVLPIDERDATLSFLPLCHTYERTAGYYLIFGCGATINYAESIETITMNLAEVRPTIVVTVPRLFERIKSGLFKSVDSSPPVKKKLFYWALNVGYAHAKAKRQGSFAPMIAAQYALADSLVLSKVKERFGGRLRYFISGGAALPKETGELFEALGITILEGFGLTETSPVTHVNRAHLVKYGTVGPPIHNVEHKIAPDGEILLRGPNVMKGYWRDEQATKEVIDEDGWFHTGDIGEIDEDNYLKITDRKKHIIVNSGGKNIAPLPIENLIAANPLVEQVVVIGEKRPFLSAIIVPNFDTLKTFADQNGIKYENNLDLMQNEEVRKLYDDLLRKISRELASHEKVRRFLLVAEQFSIEKGEMTPTLKIKRKVVEQKFKEEIEALYKGLVYEAD
ncbi:MAG: long-chain fatty acid--CoA ligase [Chloroherpetonaceae bacterium]